MKRRCWPGPGLDTLIRRVILRRPEEPIGESAWRTGSLNQPEPGRLLAADLSWYRITSRDAGSDAGHVDSTRNAVSIRHDRFAKRDQGSRRKPAKRLAQVARGRRLARQRQTAAARRDLLEEASGITIPSSHFVLKVILAYLLAVVPLNWLVCRFVLNHREWAWIVVPVVALGFAVGVERVAAHDMGYDTAADEIDLLEIHGDYPRAHLTRLASLYTNGGSRFSDLVPERPDRARLAAGQRPIDPRRGHLDLDLAIISGAGA